MATLLPCVSICSCKPFKSERGDNLLGLFSDGLLGLSETGDCLRGLPESCSRFAVPLAERESEDCGGLSFAKAVLVTAALAAAMRCLRRLSAKVSRIVCKSFDTQRRFGPSASYKLLIREKFSDRQPLLGCKRTPRARLQRRRLTNLAAQLTLKTKKLGRNASRMFANWPQC